MSEAISLELMMVLKEQKDVYKSLQEMEEEYHIAMKKLDAEFDVKRAPLEKRAELAEADFNRLMGEL